MDIILNYAVLRPVADARSASVTLSSGSDFQRRLSQAGSGEHPLRDATDIAREFADSRFLRSADEVPHGRRLMPVLARLRGDWRPDADQLRSAVREALTHASPDAFAAELAHARDSVVAAYLLPDPPKADVAVDLVRAYSLAHAALTGTPTRDDIEAIVRGPMALPDFVVQLRSEPDIPQPAPSPEQQARDLVRRINTLTERRRELSETLEAVGSHAEDELILSELGERQPLNSLYLPAAARERRGSSRDMRDALSERRPLQPAAEPDRTSPLLRASARRNVILSSKAVDLLPRPAVDTLRRLDLDPAHVPLATMRREVMHTLSNTGQQLLDLSSAFASVKDYVKINPALEFLDPAWNLDPVDEPDVPLPVNVTPPATHAAIKPLGIADLLLVRAHVSHYERSEVASIENVLAKEKLTHTVRRLDTSETTTSAEHETTDLRSQTQATAEEERGQTSVQAIGPAVGPLAAQSASSFARSVTDQVSSSSARRVRRLVTERHLRESEDRTEHLIDNVSGAATLYGVYQWLDKVYTAQIFTYGSRLLYDIVVPEPASTFREALARPRSGLKLPVKPAKFTVKPEALTVDNWAYYASGHHATGIDAPPAPEIVVSEPFFGKAKDGFSTDPAAKTFINAECRKTTIPKGYRAAKYRVAVQASGYDNGWLQVVIGSKTFTITPANLNFFRSGALDGERESIPVGVVVDADGVNFGVMAIAVGVEIVCEATDELFSAWQVRAHGQILAANQRRFEEYEEAVATRDASARIFLQSLTPARKLSIVRTEMKRAALSVLTAQSFAGFNATQNDAMGFPFPNPAATAGLAPYIRFFEQAVEWEHLAYAFYPYFWGAQTSWVSKLLAGESDPQFVGFLTSGAARVVLPIRPGYEAAFERFLATGLTPTTDELLDVGSSLWVSLVEELRHQTAENGQETAVGEPWRFRVASDLVRARTDGSMPKWTLTQGAWKDAPDPAF